MQPIEGLVAEAQQLISQGYSQRRAAAAVGVAESTLRYHLNGRSTSTGRDPEAERPYVRVTEDEAVIVAKPSKSVTDPHQLMLQMGLDPADWDNPSCVINQWGDASDPSYQLKLRLERRKPTKFVTPAVHVPPVIRSARPAYSGVSNDTVVLGDQQAPYEDPEAHALVLQVLKDLKPTAVVLTGDTVDFPDISRHKDNPEWHVSTQECIDAGYRLIRDYVEAADTASFTKLIGNHDERIRNEILNRAERLYGVRPAPTEDDPDPLEALSLRRLLHLDKLGVNLIQPNGNYTHAQFPIRSDLVVRHGWLTGANAPAKSLQSIDFNLIVGHTHRQSITKRLVHDHEGRVREQFAVETGCLCRLEGGLGYAVDPNWAQGFAVATTWEDGSVNAELATIKNDGGRKSLFFRGEKWSV